MLNYRLVFRTWRPEGRRTVITAIFPQAKVLPNVVVR
jgi:hypothetical protein